MTKQILITISELVTHIKEGEINKLEELIDAVTKADKLVIDVSDANAVNYENVSIIGIPEQSRVFMAEPKTTKDHRDIEYVNPPPLFNYKMPPITC